MENGRLNVDVVGQIHDGLLLSQRVIMLYFVRGAGIASRRNGIFFMVYRYFILAVLFRARILKFFTRNIYNTNFLKLGSDCETSERYE